MTDTIAALASAAGPARRGIIRVSGSHALAVVRAVLSDEASPFDSLRSQRYVVEIIFPDPKFDVTTALTLPAHASVWPTHRSFTGEPLVELHMLGSPPLLNDVLSRIYLNGARPAERGEFTLRAFLAGRIDLVQAEAVLGVIDAGNEHELETALEQLAGGVSGKIGVVHEELLLHLADLEAGLDFVEEDIEFVQREEMLRRLQEAASLLTDLIAQTDNRMQSTGMSKVVLAGLPNAGKSTLFNCLVGQQTAIVSHHAGTTRDYLSAVIELNDRNCGLIDTAGWEDARDGIEALAATLRQTQFERADLIVWCSQQNASTEQRLIDEQLFSKCREINNRIFRVWTKADLSTAFESDRSDSLFVSAHTGEGIEELRTMIQVRLADANTLSEIIGATAARCRESLEHALIATQQAIELSQLHAGDELISLELRTVLDHLGRIVGKVYTEDILDRIFSRFCIGK